MLEPAVILGVIPGLFLATMGLAAVVVMIRLRSTGPAGASMLTNKDGRADPERMLLLLTTLAVAGWYLFAGLRTTVTGEIKSLPDVPEWVLTALTGGHGLFLGGKLLRGLS